MKRRRPLRLWRWALLVFVSLLLPLVVFELTVRMLGAIIPGDYSTGTFLTTHPAYGRFHVPGFDGWVKTTEFTSRVTINSLGLRGPERPYAKPPGVYRVLVLGDSFVEAAQVADDNSLTSLLEDRLNAVGGERYEVLNAGVGGWGTGQQLLFLREEGYRYNPALVIVVLYLGNDVYDNSWALQGRPKNPTEPYFVFDEYGAFEPMALRARKPEDTPLVVQALRQHTLLWNIFETGVLQKLEETDDEARLRANRFNLNKMIVHAPQPSQRQDDAWQITLTLLARIRQFDEARGIQTAVVIAPAAYQVYDADWDELLRENKLKRDEWSPTHPNEVLAADAAAIGVPVLDLLPVFRSEAPVAARLYFPYNRHWTEAGHAVAARAVETFLVERGLAP